jgi:hypothetical protein
MKKLVLGLLVGALGMYFYNHRAQPASPTPPDVQDGYAAPLPVTDRSEAAATQFHCDGRQYCSQMTSCDEALKFQRNCAGMKMDGDHDGIPCEEQWCSQLH